MIQMPSPQDALLTDIKQTLNTVMRLMALHLTDETESLQKKAMALKRAGLGPKDIAGILGTSSNNVSVALNAAKKSKNNGKHAKKAQR
jgi:transcriptional regulator